MADPVTLYVEITSREGAPDAVGSTTISVNVEKVEGWEEALMLKVAHALGKDNATSITINE